MSLGRRPGGECGSRLVERRALLLLLRRRLVPRGEPHLGTHRVLDHVRARRRDCSSSGQRGTPAGQLDCRGRERELWSIEGRLESRWDAEGSNTPPHCLQSRSRGRSSRTTSRPGWAAAAAPRAAPRACRRAPSARSPPARGGRGCRRGRARRRRACGAAARRVAAPGRAAAGGTGTCHAPRRVSLTPAAARTPAGCGGGWEGASCRGCGAACGVAYDAASSQSVRVSTETNGIFQKSSCRSVSVTAAPASFSSAR